MKHSNYLLIATLSSNIWVWANGCGLELHVGVVE
jgi:hypothetical protein